MDPLTQGALGAVLPQTIARKPHLAYAGLFGFLAGLSADLDVLIRSAEDPLLFLDYHRQFSHSLIFIPIGGTLVGLLLFGLFGKRWNLTLRQSLLYATLGYATHGLLDGCTSYGTQLFWPFSDVRIAWNAISIVDPLFTLPILFGIAMASLRQNPVLARMALAWAMIYMAFGLFQRDRATEIARTLAADRGHTVLRMETKPSFANLWVWKTVYETPERFYVDAVRPGLSDQVFAGSSVAKLDVAKDFAWLEPGSQQARDIERFRRFSNGYVAQDPAHPDRVMDVRYSMVPNEINPLWSIRVSRSALAETHVQFLTDRGQVAEHARKLWQMIVGNQ